jgi:hypothetical protein
MKKEISNCPKCKISFKGEPIKKELQKDYGGAKFYSRKIGLYDRDLDRTVGWMCPDCRYTWER